MFKSNNTQDIHTYQSAFTIVELIVVIVVIGILASIAVISYSSTQNKAQRSAFESNAQQVKLKLGDYFTDNNRYPVAKSDVAGYLSATGSDTLATEFTKSAYTYNPTTNGGAACSATVSCEKYTITVSKVNWRGNSTDADIDIRP